MGVHVDERGKDHRAVHVHALTRSGDDASVLDGEIEGRKTSRVPGEAGRSSQVCERETGYVGQGRKVRLQAHFNALSL